jgi:hypothetical protein
MNAQATLALVGENFAPGAAVYFGDKGALSGVTIESSTSIQATIPAELTSAPGQYPIFVENKPGDSATRSNGVYFQVRAAAGAPTIADYSPDNGLEGDEILIIGSDLSGESLTVRDPSGKQVTSTTFDTISFVGEIKETAAFTLPSGWTSGPMTVTNSKGTFTGKTFNVGQNLARLPLAGATASSEYGGSWSVGSGTDNDLSTSWFSAPGDCASDASCTTVPWYLLTLPEDHSIARIAIRGNREYSSGYTFKRGKFEILDASDHSLWSETHALPLPDRDLDLAITPPVSGRKVKFTSVKDESNEPGFSELEVFGP